MLSRITVAYMMLIVLVSSIPADSSLPGRVVTEIPAAFQNLLHIPEYSLLFCLRFFSTANVAVDARRTARRGILFCLAFAAIDECYQSAIPGRQMSVADWLFDVAGTLTGYAIVKTKFGRALP